MGGGGERKGTCSRQSSETRVCLLFWNGTEAERSEQGRKYWKVRFER